jgi:hypothetical protein
MLTDPVTVAARAPTPSLAFTVIKQDGYGSERIEAGGNGYTVVINHTPNKSKGNAHYVQMKQTKDVTNPYSLLVQKAEASVSIAIRRPAFGFTDGDIVALVAALVDFVQDSEVTPAKLIQFQS